LAVFGEVGLEELSSQPALILQNDSRFVHKTQYKVKVVSVYLGSSLFLDSLIYLNNPSMVSARPSSFPIVSPSLRAPRRVEWLWRKTPPYVAANLWRNFLITTRNTQLFWQKLARSRYGTASLLRLVDVSRSLG